MPDPNNKEKLDRANIIQSIETPIGFFTLVVLMVEAILALVLFNVSEADRTLIVRSMIAILFIVISVVSILAFTKPNLFLLNKSKNSKLSSDVNNIDDYEYDVFVSSPMASFLSDEEYVQERQKILEFIRDLKEYCGLKKVFYAGLELETQNDFQGDEVLAARTDFDAIEKSQYFILVYPEPLPSGVLVEAGYALALKKPSAYFVKQRKDLPYLLQHLHGINNVEIYQYSTQNKLKDVIKRSKRNIFPKT